MITRPLDLASRLRPAPRNFDGWFFASAGLIALGFVLFGSRFVLAPGLGVEFQLPEMVGAREQAVSTTHNITVTETGLIIANNGPITLPRLEQWLDEEGKIKRGSTLLVRADADAKSSQLIAITQLARQAGFEVLWAAQEPAKRGQNR
jgi:biopolymer transport protein ExbD